ncbi:MAG: LptF/LptG family permease [Gloeocapsa sp. UFS-A4-WI-NPMV-4B04]|nr:LptF/LptG family permease [Gloeocapsa sp. UFS-A4-WI-NPMV-4B04]
MTSSTYKSFKLLTKSLVPMPSVMDRYIGGQLIMPFLFGVGAFSSIAVSIGAVFDLVRKVVESGLPIEIALNVFLLQLPSFVVLAFPMSTLLTTLMTYSRLSSDSELIALRGCGVSIYRLVLPAVILSFVVTGITFLFNEQIVPAANYQATLTLEQALKEEKPKFQDRNIFYPEYQEVKQPDGQKVNTLTRLFYADQFDGQLMKGLTIVDRSKQGVNQIVVAESAAWNPAQNNWDFFNGTIYLVAPDSTYRNILRFEHQQLQLPRTPLEVADKGRDYDEINIADGLERLKKTRLSGDEKKIRKLEVRIQEKIAFPFVCVVFGLVGATLGTKPQRTGRATSFGISLLVIFSYYLLRVVSGALGLSGILSPWMSAWLPAMFGFVAGGLILVRSAR